jgi:hypothetical protein
MCIQWFLLHFKLPLADEWIEGQKTALSFRNAKREKWTDVKAPALQVQSPEFKPQSRQKKKTKKSPKNNNKKTSLALENFSDFRKKGTS